MHEGLGIVGLVILPGIITSIFQAAADDPPSSQAYIFDALATASKRNYQTEPAPSFTELSCPTAGQSDAGHLS